MPRKRTNQTYTLVTVADFLAVPKHRLRECLREFNALLDMARATEELLIATGATMGLKPEDIRWNLVPKFEWTDDGLGRISLTIDTHEKPESATPAKA